MENENDSKKLISEIEKSDCVYCKRVGFVDEENRVYACYDRLLQIVSDSLWVSLSYNKSAVMRFYAYQALLSKNSPNLIAVKNRLKKDTTVVRWQVNDISMDCSISYLVSILKQDNEDSTTKPTDIPR